MRKNNIRITMHMLNSALDGNATCQALTEKTKARTAGVQSIRVSNKPPDGRACEIRQCKPTCRPESDRVVDTGEGEL